MKNMQDRKKIKVKKMIYFFICILILAIFVIANVWAYEFDHTDHTIPPMDFSEFSAGISIEKENISEDVVLEYSYTNAISRDNYEYVYNLQNSFLTDDYVFVTNEKLKEEKVIVSINFDKIVAKHNEIEKYIGFFIPPYTEKISVTKYSINSYLDFGTFVNKNNTNNEIEQLHKEVYEKYTSLFEKETTTDYKQSGYVLFGKILTLVIYVLDMFVFIAAIVVVFAIAIDLIFGD